MNEFITGLVKAVDWLNDWMARAAAVILALMTVLILIEILLWNAFSATTLIADEYSAYGLAAIIFWGAGYCLKEKGHIRITLILGFLPDKVSRAITFAVTTVTTIFMGYLWWQLFHMTRMAYHYGSTSGTLTGTPLWIPQAIMLAGAASFFLQFVASMIKTYRAIGTGEDVF